MISSFSALLFRQWPARGNCLLSSGCTSLEKRGEFEEQSE